ncbi:MFS general substrate transporter [Neolentinus lepideus HHB14362 ss-1]|uniref:MFS general substrate transporter n=1 Tax=Neolentinus lepideus HHB14362 ss-1 TaxID=1314782 RepID=A0A165Q743_9AGAM|nr:MFS general substrate transporter [Neolentinus lepideus HHB14362 ss-1]
MEIHGLQERLLYTDTNSRLLRNDIVTLNKQRTAILAEVDNANFSWLHMKVCMVASIGFFTDAYDTFAINIASTMLGYVYRRHDNFQLNSSQSLGIKAASLLGNVFGQILFGWLGDVLGRKRVYGIELVVIIFATLSQALSGSGDAVSIVGVLVVWRFLMGVGIGGDYPLSAVISSEFSSARIRGRVMTAVFAAQGWGQFTAVLVAMVVVVAYKTSLVNDPYPNLPHVDYMWRLLIGLGCIPACIALYFRLTIPETPRFTMDIERNIVQAAQDVENILSTGKFYHNPDAIVQKVQIPRASRRDFIAYFSKWENGKVLLGTAYSWFALDVAFYGLGLNSSDVVTAIRCAHSSPQSAQDAYNILYNICFVNLILSVAGLIPGYWVSFLVIDWWGRKPIQLMGFSVLTVLFIIMASAYDRLVTLNSCLSTGQSASAVFVILYCLANFFMNFGPNTTTFVIPGEAFPTRYRSTAHGISAACGKIGAIIAQVGFAELVNGGDPHHHMRYLLGIFAVSMFTGILSTLLLPETRGRTLENVSNENQSTFVRGVAGTVAL